MSQGLDEFHLFMEFNHIVNIVMKLEACGITTAMHVARIRCIFLRNKSSTLNGPVKAQKTLQNCNDTHLQSSKSSPANAVLKEVKWKITNQNVRM